MPADGAFAAIAPAEISASFPRQRQLAKNIASGSKQKQAYRRHSASSWATPIHPGGLATFAALFALALMWSTVIDKLEEIRQAINNRH
jgi:hypothetical protein